VLGEVTGAAEPLLTVSARVVLLVRVGQDVVLECADAGEPTLALRTTERTLACRTHGSLSRVEKAVNIPLDTLWLHSLLNSGCTA